MSDSLELAIEQAAYHVSNDLELGTTDKVLTAIYPVVHDYIAAATPHIRAALFDELIAEAEGMTTYPFGKGEWVDHKNWQSWSYWLRERKEQG